MNTTKTKRPRIAKGVLISSSDETYYNTLKALNRVRQAVVVNFRPISYKTISLQLVTI